MKYIILSFLLASCSSIYRNKGELVRIKYGAYSMICKYDREATKEEIVGLREVFELFQLPHNNQNSGIWVKDCDNNNAEVEIVVFSNMVYDI